MKWHRLALGVALLPFVLATAASAVDREALAAALAERAEAGSAEAIAALVPLLDDPASQVRYHAEWGLARAGAAAVPALVAALARREDDAGRARLARMLGRMGPYAQPATPELRALLADPDSSAAGAASHALGSARARSAVPDLVAAYAASRVIPNQQKMAQALKRIGADQGVRQAQSRLVPSVRSELESTDPGLRDRSVRYTWALYRAVQTDGAGLFPAKAQLRPLVPGLIAALDAPDPQVVEQALKALTLAGRDGAAAVPRIEALLDHPTLRHVALDALRSFGSPTALRVVAEDRARAALDQRLRSAFSVRDHQGHTELLPFRVAGSAEDGLRLSFRFLYPGREPRAPTHVVVHLESTSPQPRFEGVREIAWAADGVSVRLRGLDRSLSRSQRGGVIEHVSGRLPVEQFRELAAARTVGARAGGVPFTLAPEDRAALRHFAATIPTTQTPAAAP